MSADPRTRIHYTIIPDAHRHVFMVRLHITGDFNQGVTVFMPNWIAGSYTLRDFARHIISIRAVNDWEQEVRLTPYSQFSWKTDPFVSGVTIEYEVFAHDDSVRAAFLDTDTGFFNGTSVCLCVQELAHEPIQLRLIAPASTQQWQVATQLARSVSTAPRSFGVYFASNYDELADCPVRMGALTWLEFEAQGVPHTLAISGDVPLLNADILVEDVRKICTEQLKLFHPSSPTPLDTQSSMTHVSDERKKTTAPFESYLFMIDARGSGYGGLEHRSSTALLTTRDSLPMRMDSTGTRRATYIEFLGLVSHEYFHSWNVKRIKPANFIDYDLTHPTNTNLLWFFEGVTSYYDDLVLYRTGIMSEANYFEQLDGHLNSVMTHAGAKQQHVVQSGYYAWTKYYQPTANSPNATVSYYSKGALIALCLDLFIRHNSKNTHSLDDVMRALWRDFGHDFYHKPVGEQRGVTLNDIQKYITHFAQTTSGPLLYVALFSTQALPLNLLLLPHGMRLKYTAPKSSRLGARVKKTNEGWILEQVFTGGIAERAGLAPKDVLVALNRFQLSKTPDETLKDWPLNSDLVAHYWRDGVLKACPLRNQITTHQIGQYKVERPYNNKNSNWPAALPLALPVQHSS